ncbi:MAG: amidohydrolase, partial [Clostridia bacterium]|nr:amidohydrolase [Clostridia bacterium]
LASEDFAVFGKEIPSFFYWLGTGFPGEENAPWHSVDFCTNDDALPIGAALLAQSVMTALGKE